MPEINSGPPPELPQSRLPTRPVPVITPPPKLEHPDAVIPPKERAKADEITDPVILDLETYPDEELFHLAGNHGIEVHMSPKGGLVNRQQVIKALAESIKRGD